MYILIYKYIHIAFYTFKLFCTYQLFLLLFSILPWERPLPPILGGGGAVQKPVHCIDFTHR